MIFLRKEILASNSQFLVTFVHLFPMKKWGEGVCSRNGAFIKSKYDTDKF